MRPIVAERILARAGRTSRDETGVGTESGGEEGSSVLEEASLPTDSAAFMGGPKLRVAVRSAPRTPRGRKAAMEAQVDTLQQAVALELNQARSGALVVGASLVITGVMGAGAAIASNPWGVVTTVVTGAAGTGFVAASRDSFLSYLDLKTELTQKLLRIRGALKTVPDADVERLDGIQTQVDDVYKWLEDHKPKQP